MKRIDVNSQGVHFPDGLSPKVSEIVRNFHEKLSSPLHILQSDGTAKIVTPNIAGIAEKCQIVARLLTEKIQPGTSLYDTARGFFAEHFGTVLLDSIAKESTLGKFRILPAPPQCDTGSSTEKSGDIVLVQQFTQTNGKEVSLPLVLFEVKASQRNSKRHTGTNSALGTEVPVVKVCLGDLPVVDRSDSDLLTDYFVHHVEEALSPQWLGGLPKRQKEDLVQGAKYEVAKGCEQFLEEVIATLPMRREAQRKVQNLQNNVGLAREVLGINPLRYLQQKLGA